MQRSYYTTPKPSWLMRQLWKAAGGDRYLLERATYADQMKYMCLGGVVLATGIMAALAGGYAFYTIFAPKGEDALALYKTIVDPLTGIEKTIEMIDYATSIKATIFGLVWGLIIFNIDRFIVTSTGKGDGTEAITWSEFRSAIPRIIMGAIIALTISKPIEIRMFKSEIDVKLKEEQMNQQSTYKAKIDADFNTEIAKLDAQLAKTEQLLGAKRKMYDDLQVQYVQEARIVKPGPKAAAIETQMKSVASDIHRIENDPKYITLSDEKKAIESKRLDELNKSEKVAAGLDGLLERIKLAHEVAGFGISLFITLLFMAIELTPIFFKLMLIKTPYDFMDDNVKELIRAENGIEVRYDYYKDKKGQERHLVVHHQAERIIAETKKATEAHERLTEHAIEQWEARKKQEIDANPDKFISITDNLS